MEAAQGWARVGQVLSGKWYLESLIGSGGMAAVYAASGTAGERRAIKLAHPEVVASPEGLFRFLREGYIANRIGHPGAVTILEDDVADDGTPFLVMELLEGESVEDRSVRFGGRLPLEEVLAIADQVLDTLEVAHGRGIVHRDLKPENLFVTSNGRVKILDFGIARLTEELSVKITRDGRVIGSPPFMPPEQALGRWSDVDERTDIWALGATMFTLLTGESVHDGQTANELVVASATRPARSLARAATDVPPEVVHLVDRALAYDRGMRFESAATIRAALRGAASSETPVELDASGPPPGGHGVSPAAPATSPEGRGVSPTAPTMSADGQPGRDRPSRSSTSFLGEARSSPSVLPEEVAALRELFKQLEQYLSTLAQYGADHAEVTRRFERLFAMAQTSLAAAPRGLFWGLAPSWIAPWR